MGAPANNSRCLPNRVKQLSRAKEFLSRKKIDFVAIDVLNDPQGRERLLKLGVANVPVVAKGEQFVFGQNLEDVAEFVGCRAPATSRCHRKN